MRIIFTHDEADIYEGIVHQALQQHCSMICSIDYLIRGPL